MAAMDETPDSPNKFHGDTLQPVNSVQDCSFSQDVTDTLESKLQGPSTQVSNTDQLFRRDALIMILETSTSPLFQVL
jgi:hypothetical protein